MSGRRVSFTTRDSPPSGSSRYTSDSGVGSLSDRATNASRAFPSPGSVIAQWNHLPALQDAYRALYDEKDRYKAKAQMLHDEATKARKLLKESEASYRGLSSQSEQLEEERNALLRQLDEKQALVEKLRNKLEDLEVERSERKRSSRSPPTMSGANPEPPKPKRSASKRESREVKESKDEKRRLEKRFEAKDGDVSESTASSRATRSSRRSSYIEPFGPKSSVAPSPRDGPPTQQFQTFSQSPEYQPTYAKMGQPSVSAVPRTIHPSVHIQATPAGYFEEDGQYHPYPLPREPREPHGSRSGR